MGQDKENSREIDIERLHSLKKGGSLHAKLHTSTFLTRTFIKLNISANQVTFLSCVFGLMGILGLYMEYRILSVSFFYFYTVLDYSDGWVARYTGTESKQGYNLDHINHGIVTTILLSVTSILTGYFLFGIIPIYIKRQTIYSLN